jgi:hypothetical protein
MTPTASLLLPAPPFVSISDVRRLQLPPRGRHRLHLCWRGVEWSSVQTRMASSFVGMSEPYYPWNRLLSALFLGILWCAESNSNLFLLSYWHADFVFLWRVTVGSRTRRRNVICASLFGVGAPEALVIGVVALLVFGPKGLAEVNYLRLQAWLAFCSCLLGAVYSLMCLRGASNWEKLATDQQDRPRYRISTQKIQHKKTRPTYEERGGNILRRK